MKLVIRSAVILSLGLLPVISVMSVAQVAWGQTQNSQSQALKTLLEQAWQQTQQQAHQQAIETLQKALVIARQFKDRDSEAEALLGIGFNLRAIGQRQEALNYYNHALPILRAVGDRSGEASTLSNIGVVYRDINHPVEAGHVLDLWIEFRCLSQIHTVELRSVEGV